MTGSFVPPSSSATDDDARSRARADLVWYLRHADALARWPVLSEPWAQNIERRRLDPSDGNLTASSFSMGGR